MGQLTIQCHVYEIAAMARELLASVEGHTTTLLQQLSPKFHIVRQLVQYCQKAGEKLVIFSENHATLASLENMLQVTDCFTQAACGG